MREKIYAEIDAERAYQDGKFGTTFDDANTPNDWIAYITAYAARGFWFKRDGPWGPFRVAMVKVAALAVAAIEAVDRKV